MTRGKNYYLSNAFAYFDENEKRTKRMTVLTLPMYVMSEDVTGKL